MVTVKKFRSANSQDIEDGLLYLKRLLKILENHLEIVVLFGKKAQKVKSWLIEQIRNENVKVYECPHPSPQCLNRYKGKRKEIRNTLGEIVSSLR